MKVQWQGHFLWWKKIVMEIAKIDIWNRKCLIKINTALLFILYHMLKDKAWWSILMVDTKDGPGNAINEAHMEIIWGSCVKVERTILYIQMLLMNWLKIWKKRIQHGIGLRLIMNVQWQGHFLWKKIMMEIAKIDIWNRKCLIKYSLITYFF